MAQIGKLIGKRKYEALKALDLENITDKNLTAFNLQFKSLTVAQALKMIEAYETKYTHLSTDSAKKVGEYFEKINALQEKKEVKQLDKKLLWKLFAYFYKINEGVDYSEDKTSIENLKPLIYYFIGDLENFKKCAHVSMLSEPSLSKGLLIIGGYGNGKTSVMRSMESVLMRSNICFKGYTANEVVEKYESCAEDSNKNEKEKTEFWKVMKGGTRWFDDVLTERVASNYGKVDLFKDIFEKRYDLNKRTYITINYKDDTNDDLKIGLEQLGERYGSRVYDRVFSMFNIVEFKGKSFRK